MDYFKKIETLTTDLTWNIPEQKQGRVNIIGGSLGNFRTEVRIAEYFSTNYPVEATSLVLPDALKSKLPGLPNFIFLPSTDSGSFAESQEFATTIDAADYSLVLGDLSKNAITGRALSSALQTSEKPIVATRDSVDLITDNSPERILMRENLILFASMAQLQKLFRAVYYPKMLLLSSSLIQVADALHKFTLSYPVRIITLHSGQILIAGDGNIRAIPIEKSGYPPITFWNGELASKITVLNLYNPNAFLDATISAIFSS